MNVNDLRSIVTLLSMLCFAGIVLWAWSRGNRERFDEARNLPFSEPGAEATAAANDPRFDTRASRQ